MVGNCACPLKGPVCAATFLQAHDGSGGEIPAPPPLAMKHSWNLTCGEQRDDQLAMLSHPEKIGGCDTVLPSHAEKAYSSRRAKPIGLTTALCSYTAADFALACLLAYTDGMDVARLIDKTFLQSSRTRADMMDRTAQYHEGWRCYSLAPLREIPIAGPGVPMESVFLSQWDSRQE